MAELVISELEVNKLSGPALELMKAAVLHAHNHRRVRLHTMSIEALCRLAGLVTLPTQEFAGLLNEACKSIVVVEMIDTAAPDRDDLPFSSWPVFSEIMVAGASVSFEICHRTFDERLLSTLPALRANRRTGGQKQHQVGYFSRKICATGTYWKTFLLK